MLLLIASHLETEIDINSLSQANRRLHNTLDSHLYKQNAKKSNGSALSYAALYGKPLTACKALDAGADISNIDSFVNNENKKRNHENDIHMLINDAATRDIQFVPRVRCFSFARFLISMLSKANPLHGHCCLMLLMQAVRKLSVYCLKWVSIPMPEISLREYHFMSPVCTDVPLLLMPSLQIQTQMSMHRMI